MPGHSTVTYVEDPIVVRRLIQLPVEEAWPRILDAYRAEGLVPDGIDLDRRLISVSRFEWSRVRGGLPLSTFLECGVSSTGGPLADGARIIGSIAFWRRRSSGGSRVGRPHWYRTTWIRLPVSRPTIR
jgi:hypothetical protein